MRREICGIPYDDITAREIGSVIEVMLQEARSHVIYYCNAETVVRGQRDAHFLEALSRADCIFPDGMGLKLFCAWGDARIRERVAGIDVLYAACERAAHMGKRVFLFGAEKDVVERAAIILREKFPALSITGALDGYNGIMQWKESDALKNADMVIVGMGTPKQEEWIDTHRADLPRMRVALAVGGAFDMIAGKTPRAPARMRAWGFEWLWRLCREPRRWRRIINAVIVFPIKAVMWHRKEKEL